MRSLSLSLKLTLAFLFVGVAGALLVALFVGHRTQSEFDQFVLRRFQTDMVASLQRYYEENGSWQGLNKLHIRMPYGPGDMPFARSPVVVTDADGVIIHGVHDARVGEHLSAQDLSRATPVQVNGETVGWVLVRPSPPKPLTASPETAFLERVRQAILLGAVGASIIALLLGALLARSITRPIKTLTRATERVARGELGLQVQIDARDELGELADTFNRMSRDLAEASRLRRQMTADIAHDLRTPLTVILGYTEAMADGKMAGDPALYTAMHEEAQHLQHLVEDLRLLSLADAGELELHRQPVSPGPFLERLQRAHQLQAQVKNISLALDIAPDLPSIFVDRGRMTQVLSNLISNALRHTPAGGQVTLAARRADDRVQISVRDTGVGIEPTELPHIFERHYRGDKARRQEDGASGLGLAIAKAIVTLHGGEITVVSKPGAGAAFTITLGAVEN